MRLNETDQIHKEMCQKLASCGACPPSKHQELGTADWAGSDGCSGKEGVEGPDWTRTIELERGMKLQ